MEINASAIRIFTVITVSHAQPQEYGISLKINAFVQLQKLSGLDHHVNALLVNMEITVHPAQPQDTGIQPRTNVYAEAH